MTEYTLYQFLETLVKKPTVKSIKNIKYYSRFGYPLEDKTDQITISLFDEYQYKQIIRFDDKGEFQFNIVKGNQPTVELTFNSLVPAYAGAYERTIKGLTQVLFPLIQAELSLKLSLKK